MVFVSGNYFYEIHIEVDCHYELSANNQFKRIITTYYYYNILLQITNVQIV